MKYTKRGGQTGGGLGLFFSDAKLVEKDTIRNPFNEINAFCIGVIRTKGGSGESHLVDKLTLDYKRQGNKVLVASINEVPGQNEIKDLDRFFSRLEDGQLFTESDCIRVIVDWTRLAELNKLLCVINNIENLVTIFTVGTASAGGVSDRIEVISPYCKEIYLSVAMDVFGSVDTARHYILGIQQSDIVNKLTCGCWNSKRELTSVPANAFEQFIADNTNYSFD